MKRSLWAILFWLLSPAMLLAQEADLRLSKSADPLLVNLGAMVTWTLLAENLGPDSPNMVSIQDTLPDGIELLELDSRCAVNPQNSSLVECLLPLANAEMQTLVIRVRVASPPANGTQVVNAAIIADATAETSDPLTSNNTATASSGYIEGPLPLDLLISEVIQVIDLASVLPPVIIVVNEVIMVSDDSNIVGSLALLIEENIQVLDTAIPAPALSILVTESVSVSDSLAAKLPVVIHVFENIVLADQATTFGPKPEIIFISGFESCAEGSTLPSCSQP